MLAMFKAVVSAMIMEISVTNSLAVFVATIIGAARGRPQGSGICCRGWGLGSLD